MYGWIYVVVFGLPVILALLLLGDGHQARWAWLPMLWHSLVACRAAICISLATDPAMCLGWPHMSAPHPRAHFGWLWVGALCAPLHCSYVFTKHLVQVNKDIHLSRYFLHPTWSPPLNPPMTSDNLVPAAYSSECKASRRRLWHIFYR